MHQVRKCYVSVSGQWWVPGPDGLPRDSYKCMDLSLEIAGLEALWCLQQPRRWSVGKGWLSWPRKSVWTLTVHAGMSNRIWCPKTSPLTFDSPGQEISHLKPAGFSSDTFFQSRNNLGSFYLLVKSFSFLKFVSEWSRFKGKVYGKRTRKLYLFCCNVFWHPGIVVS